MTERERILSVYAGTTPDVVPFMLDLSHWFYHANGLPWDLSAALAEPERELIDYHLRANVGFYVANLASFYSTTYADDVQVTTAKRCVDDVPQIVWRIETPLGAIERSRRWEERTYAWAITKWGIVSELDLRVFAYAMRRRTFHSDWRSYRAWRDYVGDVGVVYMSLGYSAMGHLLHYWMGIENVVYAAHDTPQSLHAAVDAINENSLDLVDLIAESPAEVVIMGDNFSSDVQSPRSFAEWSEPHYREAVRRLHAAGKHVAVHIDGKLRQAIGMIAGTGADCGDAITPGSVGGVTPDQCRSEAGPDFILSGGIAPDLWLPDTPVGRFRDAVTDWLDLRKRGPRLIAAAGDQVPPGAEEERIALMRELVDAHGRY